MLFCCRTGSLDLKRPLALSSKFGELPRSTFRRHHQLLHIEAGTTLQRVQLIRLACGGACVWLARK